MAKQVSTPQTREAPVLLVLWQGGDLGTDGWRIAADRRTPADLLEAAGPWLSWSDRFDAFVSPLYRDVARAEGDLKHLRARIQRAFPDRRQVVTALDDQQAGEHDGTYAREMGLTPQPGSGLYAEAYNRAYNREMV